MTHETLTTGAPPGYVPLGQGQQCKCPKSWRSASGTVWCCKTPSNANLAPAPGNTGITNAHGIVAQNGVVTLSVPMLDSMLDAAREEGRRESEAIPAGVYYREGNFYADMTRRGMGVQFWERWRHRRNEFPTAPPAPAEAVPDWVAAS